MPSYRALPKAYDHGRFSVEQCAVSPIAATGVIEQFPTFSIHDIPFSYYGSWLDLSPVVAEHRTAANLHLVSHRTGMNAVLSLIPMLDGLRAPTEITAAPTALNWAHPQGRITAAFENADTIRLRGNRLALNICAAAPALTPFGGSYFLRDPLDGALMFTDYQSGHRYRITVLAGAATVIGDQALGSAERGAVISADNGDVWEIAVEEFRVARQPYRSEVPFDAVIDAAVQHFSAFLDDVAPWRSDRTPAAALAAYVLWSAIVRPAGYLGRPAVLMSKHWMDKVWSWDHCFNAIALAAGRPALAMDQFLLPFDHQSESGALPDSVCQWGVLSNFVKPPIHGWALRRIRARLPEDLDEETVTTIYSKLSAWARFWLDHRRVPGEQLPYYQHGNDSGWDNATVFDAARVLQTADLSALLVGQLRELASLAAEIAAARRRARVAAQRRSVAAEVVRPAVGRSAVRRKGSSHRRVVVGAEPAEPDAHHARRAPAARCRWPARRRTGRPPTDWGLATEALSSERYRSDGYWRGPIWAPATVLVEDGLRGPDTAASPMR